MSESTKYEGHKPENKEYKVLRTYDMPLKNEGKWMRSKLSHKTKARSKALKSYRHLGDINN